MGIWYNLLQIESFFTSHTDYANFPYSSLTLQGPWNTIAVLCMIWLVLNLIHHLPVVKVSLAHLGVFLPSHPLDSANAANLGDRRALGRESDRREG